MKIKCVLYIILMTILLFVQDARAADFGINEPNGYLESIKVGGVPSDNWRLVDKRRLNVSFGLCFARFLR